LDLIMQMVNFYFILAFSIIDLLDYWIYSGVIMQCTIRIKKFVLCRKEFEMIAGR
jgi:hypothetical protein